MRRTFILAAIVAAMALSVGAGTVLAGGWATITPDSGSDLRPNAGQTVNIGFTVLQHGETPAGWVNALLVATDAVSGETLRVAAQQAGGDGHFNASVTFPSSGFWSWRVELAELEVETPPFVVTVLSAAGEAPTFDPSMAVAIVDRARADIRAEVMDHLAPRIESLEGQLQAREAELRSIRTQLTDAGAVDAGQAVANGASSVPVFALVALAALAGASTSFVMTLLARRGEADQLLAAGSVPTTR